VLFVKPLEGRGVGWGGGQIRLVQGVFLIHPCSLLSSSHFQEASRKHFSATAQGRALAESAMDLVVRLTSARRGKDNYLNCPSVSKIIYF
jgi:hypothetical protein